MDVLLGFIIGLGLGFFAGIITCVVIVIYEEGEENGKH